MTSMLIRNARIIDGTTAEAPEPIDIAIENGRFVEVGKAIGFRAEAEIDLAGGFVMPGLIDCHVHVIATSANLGLNAELPDSLIALRSARLMNNMLMRGFTTVRDLGGANRGLQQAVEEELIDAPRLVICGKALSQTGGHTDYRGPYHNRDVGYYKDQLGAMGRLCDGVPEVLRAAREELKGGAQFVKIMADGGVSSPSDPVGYLVFSEDEIRASVQVAKNFGTYVSAHLYDDRAIVRALDCGVECIEHGNLISDESIARIAREGQVIVPTNIAYEALARDGQKYGLPPESVAKIEDVRSAGLEKLEKLHEAGVTMGYGSDLLGGLHQYQSEEFAIRGRYLPADAVIRSATVDAAKILRMEGQVGVITHGAHADLIVVQGNPLDDLNLLASGGKHLSMILQGGKVKKKVADL